MLGGRLGLSRLGQVLVDGLSEEVKEVVAWGILGGLLRGSVHLVLHTHLDVLSLLGLPLDCAS